MIKGLIVSGIIAIAAVNSPWLVEGGSNNCAAAERFAMRLVKEENQRNNQTSGWLAEGLVALSDGRLVAHMAAKKWPDTPTPLSCGYAYWRLRAEGKPLT